MRTVGKVPVTEEDFTRLETAVPGTNNLFTFEDLARAARWSLPIYACSRLFTLVAAYVISILSEGRSLVDVLAGWDGEWYLRIAEEGYSSGLPLESAGGREAALAFFPGYPLAIRAAAVITPLSPEISGISISLIGGACSCLLIWLLAKRLTDARTADRTVVLFAFFPSAFVLSMVYSEGLFLVASSLFLLALVAKRWGIAGIAAALAGFIRPTGVTLMLCSLLVAGHAVLKQRSPKAIVTPLMAPMGALLFFAYSYFLTGESLATLGAQEAGWGQRFDFGASNVGRLARALTDPGSLDVYSLIPGVAAAAAVVMAVFVARWRPQFPVIVYMVTTVGAIFMTSTVMSLPRFLIVAFPALIPLAKYLNSMVYWAVVSLSAGLMLTLFTVTSLTGNPP